MGATCTVLLVVLCVWKGAGVCTILVAKALLLLRGHFGRGKNWGGGIVRCAKRRLFSTTGSHGSQGPEFCTPCCVEVIMHASVGGWF